MGVFTNGGNPEMDGSHWKWIILGYSGVLRVHPILGSLHIWVYNVTRSMGISGS